MCVRHLLPVFLILIIGLSACGSESSMNGPRPFDRIEQKATDVGNPNIKQTKLVISGTTYDNSNQIILTPSSSLGCLSEIEGDLQGLEIRHELVMEGDNVSLIFELNNEDDEVYWEDFSDFIEKNQPTNTYCVGQLVNTSNGQLIQISESSSIELNITAEKQEISSRPMELTPHSFPFNESAHSDL